MKTKGITFWEQHVEHIVLGIAVLVLLGFTAMQFIGDPNSVDVPGAGTVGPAQIDNLLEQRATTIAQKMDGPALDIPVPPTVADQFDQKRQSGVAPAPTMLVSAPNIRPLPEVSAPIGDRMFVVPNIPAPTNLMAQQYFDTLSEELLSEYSDLKNHVSAVPPHDISWITIASTFDASVVRKQFAQGATDQAPLPPAWFNNRVEYIDVKIEREELTGGQWGNLTLLEPIPGQLTVRPLLAQRIDASTRDQILADVANPAPLIQPEFYTGAAAAWAPPNQRQEQKPLAAAATDDEIAIAELKESITRYQKELERVIARMKKEGCPENAPPPPQQPGGRSGGGAPRGGTSAPGGGDVSSGGGKSLDRERDQKKVNESLCKSLRTKRDVLKKRIADAEAELAKLTDVKVEAAPEQEQEAPELALQDSLLVWGHDITIEPGKTYRYRIQIEIYNPLFARKLDLMPAQQHMAEQFTLASAVSEWSQPITADPPLRVFVTEARPAGAGQAVASVGTATFGNARVEVYRFRDGRWWQEVFTVQPGERVGGTKAGKRGTEVAIDYTTDWFVLDIVPELAADEQQSAKSGLVVLQSLSDPALNQFRLPREDSSNPDLLYLRQEVRAAGSGEPLASTSGR